MKRIKFEKLSKRALQIKLVDMKYRHALLVAGVLDNVSAKYDKNERRVSYTARAAFDRKKKGSYTANLLRVYDYLEQLRGNFGNPMEHMAEDYFMCIYDMYAKMRKLPYYTQLSPSTNNQLKFEDWITALERDIAPDKYFMNEAIDIDEMKKDAAKRAEGIMKKRSEKPVEADDVKITVI